MRIQKVQYFKNHEIYMTFIGPDIGINVLGTTYNVFRNYL